MNVNIDKTWDQLTKALSAEQSSSELVVCIYLILGGLMSLYVRFLYRRYGATANDADSVTRVFPLLTLVTIGVIAVVKSSMALSLGLVGALSIVRFRSAIKEPEELVYLFLCIGIGLSLGANQPLIAVVLLAVSTIFIWGMHATSKGKAKRNLLITVSGDASAYFSDNDSSALKAIERVVPNYVLQRLDIESGRGSVRVMVQDLQNQAAGNWLITLRQQLPECEVSFVNLDSTW